MFDKVMVISLLAIAGMSGIEAARAMSAASALKLNLNRSIASTLNVSDFEADALESCSGYSDEELAQYSIEAGVEPSEEYSIEDCMHAVAAEYMADAKFCETANTDSEVCGE